MDIDELLRPLRDEYIARMPGHLDTLDGLLLRMRRGEDARHSLRDLAHRLRGTAGTYGLSGTGDALAKVDDLLTDAHEPLCAADLEIIADCLREARASFATCSALPNDENASDPGSAEA